MTVRLSHSSLTGHRAHAGRGRHGERGVHVLQPCARGRRAGSCTTPRRSPRPSRRAATPSATGLVVPLAGSAALASGRGLATGRGRRRRVDVLCDLLRRCLLRRLLGSLLGGLRRRGRLRRGRFVAPFAWDPFDARLAISRTSRWSGSTSPTSRRRSRDRACTGRASPPRATHWLRSRWRGPSGTLGDLLGILRHCSDSPLPGTGAGSGVQSPRLDPGPAIPDQRGGFSAWCAREPHHGHGDCSQIVRRQQGSFGV